MGKFTLVDTPFETRSPQKMSVSQFNSNPEVKQLSSVVHTYLNENLIPGSKLLGIKESPKEFIKNPAESIRDEIGSLSTLAARRAAINNAPENVKKAYAKLLDLWENQTEIKGFGEGLTAVKDYAIDIFTSPENFVSLGAIASKTALQTALKGSGVGAAWAGTEDYVRQSKDVEINRIQDISAPQVLTSVGLGAATGLGLGAASHKLAKAFSKKADQKLLNKIESEELEKTTAKDDIVPVTDKVIEQNEIDTLRDKYFESQRELSRRDRLFGTQRKDDFIPEAVESIENDLKKFNKKYGGAGEKSDQELKDLINATLIETKDMAEGQVSNTLTYNLNRYANRYGSALLFKPSSVFDPFIKNSPLAKSVQAKFRHDSQREIIPKKGRKFEEPDLAETFKEEYGTNLVAYKRALDPIQGSISGKLFETTNNVLAKLIRNPNLKAESETLDTARKNIRGILDKIGDDLFENGVIQNKVENNYFPRSWDRKAIEANKPDFANKLIKSGQAKDINEANDIIKSMLNKNNQLDQGGSGAGSFFYKRPLSKIKDDNLFEQYLDSNVNAVINNYIIQSGKAVAKRKVLGVNNLDEFTSFYIDGIDSQMRQAGKELSLRDKKAMQKVYNYATGENLDRFEGFGGLLIDIYGTFNRMAYLPLSTISSLTEIAINIAKAGPTLAIKGLTSALNDARGTIQDKSLESIMKTGAFFKGKKDFRTGLTEREAWRELQEFGMNIDSILMDNVERLSGNAIQNQTLQKVNNVFFRVNLLDQWTRFVQLTSYKTGKLLVAKNLREINKLKTVKDSSRIRNMKDQLNELGVDIEQGLKWVEGGESLDDPFYKNIKRGAARYTNEVILNPTGESGLKPFWVGDPKSSILFQFLGYPIAFTNVVLKNAAKDIVRNPTQNAAKVLATGLIMTEMARWTNWARTRGESEKNKKPEEIYAQAFERWGGFGVSWDAMNRLREASEIYQDPIAGVASAAGPVTNDIYKLFRRGDLVRIFGEKIPGYGALGLISPEAKRAYTDLLKETSKDARKGSLEVLDVLDKTELRINRQEGGLISTGATVDDVPNVIEEPEERINPYTGEPYDVTAGPSSQDRIDRNDTSDPLRRLGFSKGSMVARVDIVKEYLMPRERKEEGGKNQVDLSMLRLDGSKKSNTGFLGPIKSNATGQIMTEFSTDLGDKDNTLIPTLVPTQPKKNIEYIKNMKEGQGFSEDIAIERDIVEIAREHAIKRISDGKSPFYVDGEERLKKVVGAIAKGAAKGIKLFHGTGKDFDKFDSKFAQETAFGKGFSFTPEKKIAKTYAGMSPKRIRDLYGKDYVEAALERKKDSVPILYEVNANLDASEILLARENFQNQNQKIKDKINKLIEEENIDSSKIDFSKPKFWRQLLSESNKEADELFSKYGIKAALKDAKDSEIKQVGGKLEYTIYDPKILNVVDKQRLKKNEGSMVDYVIGKIQSIEPAIAKLVGFNEKDLQFAIDSDKQYNKESRYRGQGDSIRHVMLGVAAARAENPELAFRAIQLRESFPGDRRDSRKDKKNNEIGFNLGKEVKSMEEAFKKANILYSENKLAEFGE